MTTVRRILVALDASPPSLEALAAAADLAGHFGCELAAVFVEDIDLVRLADWSHAPARLVTGFQRDQDPTLLGRMLRLQANAARQAADRLRASFSVRRGRVAAELAAAAAQADLVVLGCTGRTDERRVGLGSTARALLESLPRPVLVLRRYPLGNAPVAVLVDSSEAAPRAVAVAARLAQDAGRPLHFLMAATTEAEAKELERAARRAAGPAGGQAAAHWLPPTHLGRLAAGASPRAMSLLVLPAGARDLVATLRCSAVLVP